jgi:hypothetical protein
MPLRPGEENGGGETALFPGKKGLTKERGPFKTIGR